VWSTTTTSTSAYVEHTVDLGTAPGANQYLAFETGTAGHSISIDDVYWEAKPACTTAPSGLGASLITATTARISWTAPTPAPGSGYEIYYSTSSTAPTSGTTPSTSVGAGVLYVDLSGLSASTPYYVWVRCNCNGTDKGAWVALPSFATTCAAISSFPWTENFDLVTIPALPSCWLNITGTRSFVTSDASYSILSDPRSLPNYVTIFWGNTSASYLWTPGFQLTSGQSYDFSFWFVGDGYAGYVGDVMYNTAQSATGATAISPSFVTSGTVTLAGTNYTQVTRSFIPPSNGVYYFGIRNTSSTNTVSVLGFDDFRLDLTPVCSGAVGGTASGSATFCGSGTPSITASGYSTGTGSAYQWMSSTNAGDYPNGGSAVSGQTNPASLTTG